MGARSGVPWGISESAYNARDMEFTYQYSNFGVPGLGLKRGLADNVVIAPYATGLAAMVDPHGALRQLRAARRAMGALGRYGFYEALDFTPSRLPEGEHVAIVRTFMAHHQGMTIVAIANTLQDGRMRARFHREPMIQASELLLQERMPRDVAVAHPRAEEVNGAATRAGTAAPTVRRVPRPRRPRPDHASAVQRPLRRDADGRRRRLQPLARHRGDALARGCDLRRLGLLHLPARHPQRRGLVGRLAAGRRARPTTSEVVFGEDHAEFIRRDGTLTTTMEVLVSGEDDGEVRRVSLTNSGRQPREIELTSYAELVLTTPAADAAHPAFSKLFVETEYLAEFGALLATRRPRAHGEPQVLGRALRRGGGRHRRRSAVRDRPRALPRPRPDASAPRPPSRTAVRCRTPSGPCSIRSSRCAAACGSRPAESRASRSGPWSRPRARRCST